MKRIILSITSIVISIFIITILFKNINSNSKIVGESWIAYFAPTYTNIAYGNKNAKLVRFDKFGNVEGYKETAYPFASVLNFNDTIMYQTHKGINEINTKDNETNILLDKKTVGYNMANVLENKQFFYFLLNESFKEEYYSSNIIIGDKENQKLHQIEGFINGYGDDGDNIYLLSSDMKNKNLKHLQKISLDGIDKINIEKNDIIFDTIISANNKMIIIDDYIYCFAVKESFGISMLKFSSDTLELVSVNDLIQFNAEENSDIYYPISTDSIFYKEDKIYYPMLSGDVYSFNIKTSNFVKEFSIDDYSFDLDSNILSYYSEDDSEIYFLYHENKSNEYCLNTYNLNGTFKDKIYLDKLPITSKMYPHSFIKSKQK